MTLLVDIYRSGKKEGLYLYVPASQDLSKLPLDLMNSFGNAELAMKIVLESDRKLANANAEEVLEAINSTGFYLQMPPVFETHSGIDLS